MRGKSFFLSTGWMPSSLSDSGAIRQKIRLAASVKSHILKKRYTLRHPVNFIKRGGVVSADKG
jgi:hypothetical protein